MRIALLSRTSIKISSMVLSMGVLINLCSYPMVGVLYVARKEGMDLGISQIVVTMIILIIIVNGTSGIPQVVDKTKELLG